MSILNIFCRHDWKEISRVEVPSILEKNDKSIFSTCTTFKQFKELVKTKTIIILSCSKCGKLDKTKVINPNDFYENDKI